MRPIIHLVTALALAGSSLTPAMAQTGQPAAPTTGAAGTSPIPELYETGGKTYKTLEECQRAKKRAKARAAIAGAVIAGAATAALGGNVGETALVAGAGALAGRELAKSKNKQC